MMAKLEIKPSPAMLALQDAVEGYAQSQTKAIEGSGSLGPTVADIEAAQRRIAELADRLVGQTTLIGVPLHHTIIKIDEGSDEWAEFRRQWPGEIKSAR